MSDLLPCPFCAAKMRRNGDWVTADPDHAIDCPFYAKDEMSWVHVDHWQKRAAPPAPPAGNLTAETVLALMHKVIDEHQSSEGDFAELGRYTWPERWDALKEAIAKAALPAPSEALLRQALEKAFSVMIDLVSYPVAMGTIGPICRDRLDGAIELSRRVLFLAPASKAKG